VTLAGGALGRAIAPAGASTWQRRGSRSARRRQPVRWAPNVMMAVGNVNGEGSRRTHARRRRAARPEKIIDDVLIALDGTPNKARLGANALVGTSMAVLHAAARGPPACHSMPISSATGPPSYRSRRFKSSVAAAHAGRRVDIQDFMVVAPKARSFAEALEWTAERSTAGRPDDE